VHNVQTEMEGLQLLVFEDNFYKSVLPCWDDKYHTRYM